jgi:hypothetical protein
MCVRASHPKNIDKKEKFPDSPEGARGRPQVFVDKIEGVIVPD